ncbi:MAG: repair protein RecO, repair protein RecO [Parcubacteria group bacterium]|nr:repair protein RecO, repair protein RecO [Parcubacteria group bacterium]
MAYHIYTTRGIVLGSYPSREADRVYSILTEELGLVRARARSVRAIQSKLRGALEPFSLSSVSLVRGQDSWRITGATLLSRLDKKFFGDEGLHVFSRIFSLLEKLVAGEEAHKELLTVLETGLSYVTEVQNAKTTEGIFGPLEILIVLRLLHELGYISESDVEREFLSEPYSADLLLETKHKKKVLVEAINHGLRSSSLV